MPLRYHEIVRNHRSSVGGSRTVASPVANRIVCCDSLFLLLVVIVLVLLGCRNPMVSVRDTQLTAATPTNSARLTEAAQVAPPYQGGGVVRGTVASIMQKWPQRDVIVYACPFYRTSDAEGFYVLEPSLHPSASLGDDGGFVLTNIPEGEYVLIVGPSPDEARALVESGEIRRVDVVAGASIDLGMLHLP